MDKIFYELIERSVPQNVLPILQEEIRAELVSHIESQIHELALQGITGIKVFSHINSSFGEPTMIQQQFQNIHWFSRIRFAIGSLGWRFISWYFVLQFFLSFFVVGRNFPWYFKIFVGVLYPLTIVPFVIHPYFWIGIVSVSALFYVLKNFVYSYFAHSERGVRALVALAVAIAGLWLSLFLSERSPDLVLAHRQDVYAVGGFPFTAFAYSNARLPDAHQCLWFSVNAIIWLVVGISSGFVVRPCGILPKYSTSIALAAIVACMLSGNVYILFMFD
jgi:hypothetical protein